MVNKQWIKHVFFSVTEHGAIRVLDGVTTILLIRVLGTLSFGLFSVYQSWVSLILLALPYVELTLFREYGSLKKSGELPKQLRSFEIYNYFKITISLLLVLLLSLNAQPASYLETCGVVLNCDGASAIAVVLRISSGSASF